jgi:hypothetical protein
MRAEGRRLLFLKEIKIKIMIKIKIIIMIDFK